MLHLPDDLLRCLRETLSKEPSPVTLEQHLPVIRDTILRLLQGLKRKQSSLRERFEPATIITPSNSKLLARAHQQQHLVDMDDPSTKDAMSKLALQDDLAARSFVRRTSYYHTSSEQYIPIENTHHSDVIHLYLKKEDRVKKSSINQKDLCLQEIKQLFCKAFELDSSDASIYVLDPVSNVEYELEDMSDVKPYSMLAIKGKEKKVFSSMDPVIANEMKALFENVMQQVMENVMANKTSKKNDNSSNDMMIEKLKEEHQKEINSLRHELVTVRQIKTTNTKSIVVMLDEKTHAEMNESREVTQKAATLITNRLEELQDMIDQLKLDVTQRRRRPPKDQLSYCQEESRKLEIEMSDLQSRIKQFKPVWKKTWETELQRIVKEQQFLKEQEALLADLRDDHHALLQVLEQLEKISEIHERKKQLGLDHRPIIHDNSSGDLTDGMAGVMKQVSTIHVDHSRRVKALAEAERLRAKKLSQRIDAFERELTGFVELRKLKKTGGAEAIEKQRQEKDKALIKQIFVGAASKNVTQSGNENKLMMEEAVEDSDQDDDTTNDKNEIQESSPNIMAPISEEKEEEKVNL
ncbi:MAG: actin interacting protein 3-domain-containing protein [Benjaminiella poitrasii]|nr:MAG: actin interacting protein 3-domain-containing protein [Benjaminiella poitrasii]